MNANAIAKGMVIGGLFLVPITGGYVATELQSAEPGFSAFAALFGASEAPILGHLLPTALILGGLIVALVTRKAIQTPFPRFAIPLLLLGSVICGSILMSAFQFQSFGAATQWLTMLASPFAVCATLGRKDGPVHALGALALGCATISAMGILEYASAGDPSWRAFCHWVNPNAAAGMAVFGLFAAMGVGLRASGAMRFGFYAAAVMIGCALLLTGSKGGALAVLAGGGAWLLISLIARGGGFTLKTAAPVLVGVAVASVGLTKAMQFSAQKRASSTVTQPFGRLGEAGKTAEQSGDFRLLLWKSSIELIKRNPVGWGPGTFSYQSARPGLVQTTHMAHQGYLQLAVESGALALIALLAALIAAVHESFRGVRKLREEAAAPFVATVSALIAAGVHNLFDSDLQLFGTGIAFFALLGIALLLAEDGVTPEFQPRPLRWPGVLMSGVLIVFTTWFGVQNLQKSQARGLIQTGQIDAARGIVQSLLSSSGSDSEAHALGLQTASSREEAKREAELATVYGPSVKNWRTYARLLGSLKEDEAAQSAVVKALQIDPNNLPALRFRLDLYRDQNDTERALATAHRLVEVESSSAFKIRAIPESVPIETYDARLYLAGYEKDRAKKYEQLVAAASGYAEFAKTTIPKILEGAQFDPNFRFAGDGLQEANQALDKGETALREARAIDEAQKRKNASLDAAEAAFVAARGAVLGLKK